LKDIAKIMSKKFACSAAVTTEDKYGECIQIQGDIEERFDEFLASDLGKYNIPANKVKFEEVKKKKNVAPTEDE
jgi:translation initiation factor 1 (eIF-1/SUI1)